MELAGTSSMNADATFVTRTRMQREKAFSIPMPSILATRSKLAPSLFLMPDFVMVLVC